MAQTPLPDRTGTAAAPRGRGRPRVAQPKTVTLSLRLHLVEYDALCRRASRADAKVSDVGRKAIRLFLAE